jgi:DNA-binding FadR family transcriptional regulator
MCWKQAEKVCPIDQAATTAAGSGEGRRSVPLAIIEPRRLYRQVASQLRALIDSGEFPAGARLPTERELAEQLHVSRPTVREALIALEVEGRVRIRVGSGIYVQERAQPARAAPPALDGPFDILSARELVEGAVAAAAASRICAAQIEALDTILTRMEAAVDRKRQIGLDRAFHVTLAASLDNAVLARVVGELFDLRITPYFDRLAGYFETNETWRAAVGEHRAVLAALAVGDAERARRAMQDHLRRSGERFSQSFGEVAPKELRRPGGGKGRKRPDNGRSREEDA